MPRIADPDGSRLRSSFSGVAIVIAALLLGGAVGTARASAYDSINRGDLSAGGLSFSASPVPTWYVDNTHPLSSDAGPGTLAAPFRTLAGAISRQGGPGHRILVLAGTYREQITLAVSGAAGSPFILEAANPLVTVDCADDFSATGSWTLVTGNVWLASAVTWAPVQVFADGAALAASIASPGSLPARTFRYVSGTGLYVNAGGGNPGSHATRVGRRASAFVAYGRSWVSVRGFTVLHAEDKGILLGTGTHDFEVTDARITQSASNGIQVVGCTAVRIARCVTSFNGDHGLNLTSGSTGCTIEDNESANNVYALSRQANGIDLFGAPGNRILRNRFHHNQDTGLNLRSGSNNNVCVANLSWSNGDHGYDNLLCTGNLHLNEVAYGNYNDGFSIEGTSTGTRLYNCISIDNGLATAHSDLWVDSGSVPGFASNQNLFWNSTAAPPIKYVATTYGTVAAYAAASGQDNQSLQANPRFVNAPAGDFHLIVGSPAIDCGNSSIANWPLNDFAGHPRWDDPTRPNTGVGALLYSDRGAFEYDGAPPPPDQPPVVTAPATAGVAEGALLSVAVSASDPNGDPITSLTADLTGLPAGNNAVFTAGAGNTTGILSWTPTSLDAGTYTLVFRAVAAGLTGQASTVVTVTNFDTAPIVTAPASVQVRATTQLVLSVAASDPDGQPITSLTADLSQLPAGNTAVFTAGAGNTTGTLRWTPRSQDKGTFSVVFRATNTLTGSATTTIKVNKALTGGDESSAAVLGDPALPDVLALSQARPNPGHGRVSFALALPARSPVRFAVFDLQGREVWSEESDLPAGRHTLAWSGRDRTGARLPAGVYLARVKAQGGMLSRRFVID